MSNGLGRIASFDVRDNNFPLSALLPKKATIITRRAWRSSTYWGDQGSTSQCVAYAFVHYIHHGPLTYPGKLPVINQTELYKEAQKIDEWPGENYEGTSVRAGAKILQQRGFISSYYWGMSTEELKQAVLNIGPVVVGCNWYSAMDYPDANGFVKAAGWPRGGHAFLIDEVDLKKKYVRCKNSWGRNWGKKGYFYLNFDDLEILLGTRGEICLAIESRNNGNS